MYIQCSSSEIAQLTGVPFDACTCIQDAGYVLTTDHPASSYGLPVLVYRGEAYGPGDLPGLTLTIDRSDVAPEQLASIRAAGWHVRVLAHCAWCGEALPNPQDASVSLHPGCVEERHNLLQ